MTPETKRIVADNLIAALDAITWAERRVPQDRPQLALFLVNARNFVANAQAALDAEEPAPTCETCGGRGEVHFRGVKNADGVVTGLEHIPCPDCRPECETCGGSGGNRNLTPAEGEITWVCPDCAGEEE